MSDAGKFIIRLYLRYCAWAIVAQVVILVVICARLKD